MSFMPTRCQQVWRKCLMRTRAWIDICNAQIMPSRNAQFWRNTHQKNRIITAEVATLRHSTTVAVRTLLPVSSFSRSSRCPWRRITKRHRCKCSRCSLYQVVPLQTFKIITTRPSSSHLKSWKSAQMKETHLESNARRPRVACCSATAPLAQQISSTNQGSRLRGTIWILHLTHKVARARPWPRLTLEVDSRWWPRSRWPTRKTRLYEWEILQMKEVSRLSRTPLYNRKITHYSPVVLLQKITVIILLSIIIQMNSTHLSSNN